VKGDQQAGRAIGRATRSVTCSETFDGYRDGVNANSL